MVEIKTINRGKVFEGLFDMNLENKEFHDCIFKESRFENLSFSNSFFSECRFEKCYFRNLNLQGTIFQNVAINNSEVWDMDFLGKNFQAEGILFAKSLVAHSIFGEMGMRESKFSKCRFVEDEFVKCALEGSSFLECEFNSVLFEDCNLSDANFSGSKGFRINPLKNKLRGAIFDLSQSFGLLSFFGVKLRE